MKSVTIQLTRLDYFIGQCRMQARHPVNIGAWLVLAGWLAFAGLHGKLTLLTLLVGAVLALSICAIFLSVGAMTVSAAMALLARRERAVLGEHTYRITEAGLVESTNFNESLIRWGGVRALLRTGRYVYVRVTFSQFHTIPRRYFADAAADDEFWKALQPLVAK